MEQNKYFFPTLKDINLSGWYEIYSGIRAPNPPGWKHVKLSDFLAPFGLPIDVNKILQELIDNGKIRSRRVTKEFLENNGWTVIERTDGEIYFSKSSALDGILNVDYNLTVYNGPLLWENGQILPRQVSTKFCPDINNFINFAPIYFNHVRYS